jgi:predicted amidohydrolase
MLDGAGLGPGTFVLLPELGDTGFSFNLDVIVDDRTLPWAQDLAKRLQVWMQVGYAVRGEDGKGRNCASLISPKGDVLGTYQKIHPFSYGREIEHFTGGDHLLLRTCSDATFAPTICYDLRFPEIFRLAVRAGAEILTIGANWPSARQSHWRALLIARAIENQAYVIGCNRVGDDPHLSYLGGSMVVSPKGEIVAEAGTEPMVLTAEIEMDALRDWRKKFHALGDIRNAALGRIDIDCGTAARE